MPETRVTNRPHLHLLRFLYLAVALLLGGCTLDTRMSTLRVDGPVAETQLDLFMVTLWVTLFIFVVVGGVLLWVVLRFREREGVSDRPLPSQGHGNPLVEVSLIGASVFLLVIIAVPTLRAIWFTYDVPESAEHHLGQWYPGDDTATGEEEKPLTIRVTGYQWWWAFDYPQLGVTTANEMVIPAGRAVVLELRSVDVIHSFWLPRLAGKVDLIPGRANSMWLQAGDGYEAWTAENPDAAADEAGQRAAYASYLAEEVTGYYYGQCAEYCGDSHARMLFRSTVVTDEEFAAWVADQKAGHEAPEGMSWDEWYDAYDNDPEQLAGDLHEGAKLFMGRGLCATCHAVEGNPRAVGVAGPNLTKVASRLSIAAGWLNHRAEDGTVDRARQFENFYRWIHQTDEVKPGNLMWRANGGGIGEMENPLTEEEVRKISLYLQTLE